MDGDQGTAQISRTDSLPASVCQQHMLGQRSHDQNPETAHMSQKSALETLIAALLVVWHKLPILNLKTSHDFLRFAPEMTMFPFLVFGRCSHESHQNPAHTYWNTVLEMALGTLLVLHGSAEETTQLYGVSAQQMGILPLLLFG